MIEAGIDAFWTWWPGIVPRIGAAIEQRQFEEALVGEVTAKVQAIHPKLTWELGPGTTASHAFSLSSNGDPELRRATERWVRGAPAAGGQWEFHPARRGAPTLSDARLQMAEHTVALAELRFAVALDQAAS